MSASQQVVEGGIAKPDDLSQAVARLDRLQRQNSPGQVFGILDALFASEGPISIAPHQAHTMLRAMAGVGFAPFHVAGSEAFEAALLDAIDVGNADIGAMSRRYEMGRRRAAERRYVPIVSLGMGCLPWLLCARWYMRPPGRLHRLYGPFDLAAQHFDTLRLLSEGDFEQLFDPSAYRIVTTNRGKPLPYNIPTKIYFNHNRAPRWHRDDFRILIRALRHRVRNLRAALESGNVLFLHVSNRIKTTEEAAAFLDGLAQSDGPFSRLRQANLLILSTDAALTPLEADITPRCHFVRLPLPSESYYWPDAASYATEEGFAYESRIVDTIDAFWNEVRPGSGKHVPAGVA